MESRHAAVIDRAPIAPPTPKENHAHATLPNLLPHADSDAQHRLARRLADRIGAVNFDRYFGSPAMGLSLTPTGVEVAAPTGFLAALLERRFREALEAVAREELGTEQAPVRFVVREVGAPAPAAVGGQASGGAVPAVMPVPATAPRPGPTAAAQAAIRFDLSRLVVGKANRLAYEAALRLARGDSGPGTRLLYLFGPHGSGKTHLLYGVTSMARQRDQSAGVRAVSGEQFANEYIQACRHKRVETFQRLYRGLDVLGIDDLSGLVGKEGTLAEFVRTLEALHTRGARVVITGPAAPRALPGLPESLTSRLSGGMVCGLESADAELRARFVVAQMERRGLAIDAQAARYVADGAWAPGRPGLSLRELEGAVTRLEAFVRLHESRVADHDEAHTVTPAMAQRALATGSGSVGIGPFSGESHASGSARGFAPGVPMPVRFEQVAATVCAALSVRFEEVLGSTRRPAVVLARSMIVYVARKTTGLSFPEIGRGIGRPGHSTAITAFQRLEKQLVTGEAPGLPPETPGGLAGFAEGLIRAVRGG
jgi:chromosomal replication initiator protein